MSSRVGNRVTLQQARTLGATRVFEPFGTRRGGGIWTGGTDDDPTHTDTGTELDFDSISGDAQQWSSLIPVSNIFSSGQMVVFVGWEVNQAIGNLANEINIGVIWRGQGDAFSPEDRAVFRPSVGQDTDGNVRVMRNTTTTTGQVTYPTINDGGIFTNLLIDRDRSQTEFYVQKNPLVDQPDEVISATPQFIRSFGGLMFGDDLNEVVTLKVVGYIYIP